MIARYAGSESLEPPLTDFAQTYRFAAEQQYQVITTYYLAVEAAHSEDPALAYARETLDELRQALRDDMTDSEDEDAAEAEYEDMVELEEGIEEARADLAEGEAEAEADQEESLIEQAAEEAEDAMDDEIASDEEGGDAMDQEIADEEAKEAEEVEEAEEAEQDAAEVEAPQDKAAKDSQFQGPGLLVLTDRTKKK